MTHWLSETEQNAWRGLLAMTSRLDAYLNRQLHEQAGLSLADYDVLVPLSEDPDSRLRIGALAELLGWDRSRLSHHLARMQKRGLVRRQECDSDRRGAFAILTDVGRSAITMAAPAHADTVRRVVFDGLDAGQVATLQQVSDEVLRRLDPGRVTHPDADF